MNEAIKTFTNLPETKEEIKDFTNKVKNEILGGAVRDPLGFYIRLKAVEETIKAIRKEGDIFEVILDDAETYGEKTFKHAGATVTIKNGPPKWEYNDDKLETLKIRAKKLDLEIKAREKYIKELKEPEIDKKTGEIKAEPGIKIEGKTTISITLG